MLKVEACLSDKNQVILEHNFENPVPKEVILLDFKHHKVKLKQGDRLHIYADPNIKKFEITVGFPERYIHKVLNGASNHTIEIPNNVSVLFILQLKVTVYSDRIGALERTFQVLFPCQNTMSHKASFIHPRKLKYHIDEDDDDIELKIKIRDNKLLNEIKKDPNIARVKLNPIPLYNTSFNMDLNSYINLVTSESHQCSNLLITTENVISFLCKFSLNIRFAMQSLMYFEFILNEKVYDISPTFQLISTEPESPLFSKTFMSTSNVEYLDVANAENPIFENIIPVSLSNALKLAGDFSKYPCPSKYLLINHPDCVMQNVNLDYIQSENLDEDGRLNLLETSLADNGRLFCVQLACPTKLFMENGKSVFPLSWPMFYYQEEFAQIGKIDVDNSEFDSNLKIPITFDTEKYGNDIEMIIFFYYKGVKIANCAYYSNFHVFIKVENFLELFGGFIPPRFNIFVFLQSKRRGKIVHHFAKRLNVKRSEIPLSDEVKLLPLKPPLFPKDMKSSFNVKRPILVGTDYPIIT
ncbi:hypothetical protein ROZALSC1DRAFT_28951 [Rozella allomycis CSF55]|uniref:Uncharacterized protein n=1 Tax=Rozella allomycis (strain CSF55) TaxID=988480 RepID=A0A075AQK9_ROZAC|nr:hypothetical protein O9G_004973 [Rozella allomycis CSF55]RKP19444.1 hypothetical protein ROZALSC1DRAFT_28951 [Rozella allomycis CSF55]|eukprot:EPZ30877.1 hypothetical protein O9G_004973 [Rozella allomycis CSF55]